MVWVYVRYTPAKSFKVWLQRDRNIYIYKFLVLLVSYCNHNGVHYNTADVIQPNCTTRYTFQDGFFDCEAQYCLVDGPTCYAWGDAHYQSFDHRYFDFQGDCEYILTQPCNNSDFIITTSNTMINSSMSVTSQIKVVVPKRKLEIVLTDHHLIINSKVYSDHDYKVLCIFSDVRIFKTGGHLYVLLDITHPTAISWDGYQVGITPSSNWEGMLCGLCGNYNNDNIDDFILPNGSLTVSINEFGSSWLYSNTSSDCGMPMSSACIESVMLEAETRCSELMKGTFSACSNLVDPKSFIDGCKLDYCSCNDENREDCYCNSLSNYAAACASAGIIIPDWRDLFCCKCTQGC